MIEKIGNESLIELNNINFNDYVKKFLDYIDVSENTMRSYKVALKMFNEYLINNNIKTPTRETIINYREYLKEHNKAKTINLYLTSIKNFYKWLEYENITKDISKNIKNVSVDNFHLKRGLTEEEIKLVINNCKDIREELMIKLSVSCALRINEIANIRLKDFYIDKDVCMLKILGKGRNNQKIDVVKIDNRILELIKKYIQMYNVKDYLFFSTSNNNYGGKVTSKTIGYIIRNIFKKSNIDMERISPHSLRHSACELSLKSGMSIQEVSECMRHKSLSTTLVYSKEINKRESKFANNIADCLF